MNNRGFSLMELMIVVAIIGILSAIVSYEFNKTLTKSDIESQTKQMYTDIMAVRLDALYSKHPRTVAITGTAFRVYSSSFATGSPTSQTTLKFPAVWDSGGSQVTFDARGLLISSADRAICIDPSSDLAVANPAAQDSIMVSTALISMGKRQSGGPCGTATIVPK